MGALEQAARNAGENEAAVDKDPATMDARGNVGCVDYMARGACDGQGPCSQSAQDRSPMGEYEVRQGICKVGGAGGSEVEAWRVGVKGDDAMDAQVSSVGVGQVAGGGEAQLGGQECGSAVDAEDLVCGVEHMGSAGDQGEADAYSRSQGVLAAAETDHVGGVEDMAGQALGDEAAGEGGGQGLASMAVYVPGAGVAKVGKALACDEQDEGGRDQGVAAVAAARAVAGLHRVERARSNAEAHGAGCGQDRETVDQSGIEPGHVEMDAAAALLDARNLDLTGIHGAGYLCIAGQEHDAAAAGGGTEMDEGIAGRHLWGLEGTGVSSWKEAGPTRGGNALCEAEGGCRARPCSARARSAELAPRSWESQNPSTHSW
jgi:hypothetical protein